jgi:hypothetical protein
MYNEKGSLIIIGKSSIDMIDDFERMENTSIKINNFINEINNGNNKVTRESFTEITLKKLLPYKVFISFKQEFIKSNYSKNKEVIEKTLRKYGLEPIFSQTLLNDITATVIKDLNQCDACIQIYTPSKDEKNRKKKYNNLIPNHAWLFFEYGLARQRNIPIGRMIDTTYIRKDKWEKHFPMGQNRLLIDFNEDSFEEKLKELALELIADLQNQ